VPAGRLIGMLESELPPGAGFPGHVHDNYEEVFYVLVGEFQCLTDWTTAPAGSTVFIPPGRGHAFRNAGDEPARHLAIASPADAMTMIEEALQATRPPDLRCSRGTDPASSTEDPQHSVWAAAADGAVLPHRHQRLTPSAQVHCRSIVAPQWRRSSAPGSRQVGPRLWGRPDAVDPHTAAG
jgi:hypothetical protein